MRKKAFNIPVLFVLMSGLLLSCTSGNINTSNSSNTQATYAYFIAFSRDESDNYFNRTLTYTPSGDGKLVPTNNAIINNDINAAAIVTNPKLPYAYIVNSDGGSEGGSIAMYNISSSGDLIPLELTKKCAQIMASLYRLSKIEANNLKIPHSLWSTRNDEFHEALIAGCRLYGLKQMRQTFLTFKEWCYGLAYPGLNEELVMVSHQEHAQIAELAITRKADAACTMIYKHTLHNLATLSLRLQKFGYLI